MKLKFNEKQKEDFKTFEEYSAYLSGVIDGLKEAYEIGEKIGEKIDEAEERAKCPIDADTSKNICAAHLRNYTCTREKGHAGEHHAHYNQKSCCKIWRD
jgi:hypothetical protein